MVSPKPIDVLKRASNILNLTPALQFDRLLQLVTPVRREVRLSRDAQVLRNAGPDARGQAACSGTGP